MGASLSTATSATPGVLVAGTVDPTLNSVALSVVSGGASAQRISDQIDTSYIAGGGTAYWTGFNLFVSDGTANFRLHTSADAAGTEAGPQFTEAAEDSIYIVLFYGSTSAAWEFAELDDSDEDEPYTFSSASITAAGPTNDSTLRSAINADSSVIALLVDGSHANIDIANLEIADPPEAPTAPTVSSAGTDSISVALSADPTSDSPITSRDIRHKVASADDSTFVEVLGVTSPHTVSGLDDSTEYAVQWRANSGAANGTGAWSPSGTATTDTADLMPSIDAIADINLDHGGALDVTLQDPGGDVPVTLVVNNRPGWIQWDAANRRLYGTAPNAMSSTTLTYMATDADGDTASRAFSVNVLLGLADFVTPANRENVIVALVQADPDSNGWVLRTDSATRGSLLAGSLQLATDLLITRIRRYTSQFQVNDNDGGNTDLSAFFDGAGLNYEVHVQNSSAVASFPAGTTTTFNEGGNWIRWNAPADVLAISNGLTAGDRFILAFTEPADRDVIAAHTLQNVSAAATAEQVAPAATDVSASHTLQNVTASASVEQFTQTIPDTDVAAAHTLQNVSASAAVEQVAVADTDVTAAHTLQNVSAAAAVEQFTPAARDVSASHTLQNVTASATVEQRSGVALGAISDQDARQGEAYTLCVPDATGGDEPYTYTATGLPTGTVIHGPTGLIYGVPSVDQVFTVTVTVTDANGNTDSQSFDIDVAERVSDKDGISLNSATVTSATEGVLVKGEIDPTFSGTTLLLVAGNATQNGEVRNRITDQIDTGYIVSGNEAYLVYLALLDDGRLSVHLDERADTLVGSANRQFTEAAEDAIWIVVFYGSTSAAWDFSELDNADETNPYQFTDASVMAAGPANDSTLRDAINSDDTVTVLLVDSANDHIDVAGRTFRPRSDWQTEAVPTVDITTPAQTIFIGDQIKISADVSRNGDDDRLVYRYTASPRRGTFLPSYGKDTVWTAPQVRGDYVITQTVTDEDGNTVSDSVTITVAGVNFVEVDDIGVEVGGSHTSTLPVATDGNGPYTYAVTNLPAGATFDDTTRELAWTPNAPGGRMVTYTATDTDNGHTFSRSFLLMAHLPGLASYVVLVDWDGDKTFGHANADVFPDVDRGSAMRVKRGRNYGSQIYGRSVSGTLETRLLNWHGRYDKDSSTSPLAGLIVPRRRIVWAAAAGSVVYRLWEGFLDRIDKIDKTGGDDMAKLSGYDIIGLLTRDDDASIPYVASTTTGDAADAIVEAGEVDDDDLGEFEGSTVLTHFYQRRSSSWRQLQAVEEAEGGFLHVSGRGRLSMDARDARATRARSTTVQLTLTDSQTPGAGEVGILPGPKFRDPLKDLANLVRARVRTWTVSDEVDLWELDEELVLGPGDSITLRPQYMARETSPAVTEWIDPQPCTDFQAWSMTGGAGDELTGTLDVDLVAGATEATLEVTNEHATATLYVSLLKLRGKRLEEGDPVEVEVRDTDSIAAYGVRPYTIATDLLSTVMDAKDYADEIIRLYAGPTRKGAVRIQANPIFADALPLELSDRVSLTLRDFTGDMYLEAIGHALTPGLRHDMELVLSQVP